MIDRDGRIVGLVFDGNIHSIGGEYWFDETKNRTVAVDSRGIREALKVGVSGGSSAGGDRRPVAAHPRS